MAKYRLVRRKYGIVEDWIYPQKRIFSFLGIINIWSDIDSEGTPSSMSNNGVYRFWGDEKGQAGEAVNFLNNLHSTSEVIYKR